MSDLWIVFGVFIISFVGMEACAWLVHRYIMHGPLWFIHKTHHRPRSGVFESNDLFAVLFAVIAAPLFYFGARGYPPLLGIALGMIAYGVAYFLVHDVLVHRRIGHRFTPARGYLRRIHQAHHMHHAVRERDGAVSFGFLMAPRPEKLAKKLSERRAKPASTEQQQRSGRRASPFRLSYASGQEWREDCGVDARNGDRLSQRDRGHPPPPG